MEELEAFLMGNESVNGLDGHGKYEAMETKELENITNMSSPRYRWKGCGQNETRMNQGICR